MSLPCALVCSPMTTISHAKPLPPDELEQLKSILNQLFREGNHWIAGIPSNDWRRIRYHASRNRGPTDPSTDGVSNSWDPLAGYISKPATNLTGQLHHYLVVRPDKACEECNGIALLRLVLKTNFDDEPILNFHVWFHDVAPANGVDHLMFGLRLESPEGRDSSHNFFHAQPLRKYGPGEKVHGLPARLSESFPTIPLPANCLVELCLTAVLVACGKDALRNVIRNGRTTQVREAARVYWAKIFSAQS